MFIYFLKFMGTEFFLILAISFFVALFLVFYFWRKKKLDKKITQELLKKLKYIEQDIISNKEKIVVLDILLHQILKLLGYNWSFWEILKKNPKEIKNINEIWRLHKLRNTLVHELGNHDEEKLKKDVKLYVHQIQSLLKDITK